MGGWVSNLLVQLTKHCWENGCRGWVCLAMAYGGKLLYASINWGMLDGVCQVKPMECLIYGNLFFQLRLTFESGFALGSIMGSK